MNDERSFQRAAGFLAILSMPLAFGNILTSLMAVEYNFDAFTDTLLLLRAGPRGAELWRWSMVLDLFGYYLLIVPLTLCLGRWLKPRSPNWVGLFTICVLAYSLIGSIGAATLGATLPPLIRAYGAASEQGRAILEAVFSSNVAAVYQGLWNLLEELIGGVGWLGLGYFLKQERPGLGWLTMILGAGSLLDAIGTILGLEAVAMPGLYIYLVLAPIWAAALGILLLRASPKLEPS